MTVSVTPSGGNAISTLAPSGTIARTMAASRLAATVISTLQILGSTLVAAALVIPAVVARLLTVMNGPAVRLLTVLKSPAQSLVRALDQIARKKKDASPAEPPAA